MPRKQPTSPLMGKKARERFEQNLASLRSRAHKSLIKAAWKTRDLTCFLSRNQYEKVYRQLELALEQGDYARAVRICRRFGKTHIIAMFALMQCWKRPGFKVIAAAPTKLQMRQILVPAFEALLATCPEELSYLRPKWNQQLSRYEFENGSYVMVGGCDNKSIERLLGQAANLVLIDEAGYVKNLRKAIKQVFDPMVSDTDGIIVTASTPPDDPTHYFHTLCTELESMGWMIHLTVYDNDRWDDARRARQMKKAGGEHTEEWQREWLAKPTLSQDLTCFYHFHELAAELVKETALPNLFSYYHRYIVMDYGFSPDGTGILLSYWDHINQRLMVMRELLITRMNTKALAEQINALVSTAWGELEVYKWVADLTEDNRADLEQLYDLSFDRPDKSHKDANVNNVNVLLREGKIWIHPSCVNLIKQLKLCQWDKKKGAGRREFIRTEECLHFDLVDALLYTVRSVDRDVNPIPANYGFDPRTMGGNRIQNVHVVPEADMGTVTPSNLTALAGLIRIPGR